MRRWAILKGGAIQRRSYLGGLGVACVMVIGIWVASGGVIPAESGSMGEPQERWAFTTKAHFWWYGLLAGAPIAREEIRAALLDPERVYLTVQLLGDGGAQFLALDRHRGHVLWERRLAFKGWPIGGQLVQVGGRLVAALYEKPKEDLVVLGMNPIDGAVLWRVNLPGAKGPRLVGDEAILDADPKGDTVSVYFTETKLRSRVVLRATDGQRVTETSYNGFVWRSGVHRAAGLIFGYDGRTPGEYDRLLAFQEKNSLVAWSLPLSRHWVSPPTVADGSLLITDKDRLLRVDLSTGKPDWTVKLRGWTPVHSDPPVVIGSKIAVAHTAMPDPEEKQWKLSIRRLADGGQEAEVALHRGEMENFKVLRRMGDLVIVGSYFVLQVVDPHGARILATLDFEKQFSFFVYADPPAMRVADTDAQGFVVTTTDGRLRYFAAEDFRGSVPPLAR